MHASKYLVVDLLNPSHKNRHKRQLSSFSFVFLWKTEGLETNLTLGYSKASLNPPWPANGVANVVIDLANATKVSERQSLAIIFVFARTNLQSGIIMYGWALYAAAAAAAQRDFNTHG